MALPHIDYHAVLASFRDHREDCPLCGYLARAEKAFWDSVLYGQIGTEGFQDAFLSTDGFCPRHVADFSRHRDGLAVTVLYGPLLSHRIAWIDRIERRKRRVLLLPVLGPPVSAAMEGVASSLRRVNGRRKSRNGKHTPAERGRHASRHDCPLCDRIERWNEQFVRNLLRHQGDVTLRDAVEGGTGLCIPHYRTLVHVAGRGVINRIPMVSPWLRDHHRRRWREIAAEAEGEGLQRGGTAWKSLLKVMEGSGAAE